MKRDTKHTKKNETNEKFQVFFRLFRSFSYVSCLSSFLPTKSDLVRNETIEKGSAYA
jgi:hypothetical protein